MALEQHSKVRFNDKRGKSEGVSTADTLKKSAPAISPINLSDVNAIYTKADDLYEQELLDAIKERKEHFDSLPPISVKTEEEEKSLYEKYQLVKSDSFGWVQKDEEEKAKRIVEETLGVEAPHVCGYKVAIAIQENNFHYVNGIKTIIHMPDSTKDEEKYRNCTGLVIGMGPWAFRGRDFIEPILSRTARFFFGKYMKPSSYRPWYRVGDFVAFPRHAGEVQNYCGIPIIVISDVDAYMVLKKPQDIKRGF